MKKIYFLLSALTLCSCSVDDEGLIQEKELFMQSSIMGSVEESCPGFSAGADKILTIYQTEAESIESWDEVRKLYLSLLEEGVSKKGEFDPSIWDLIQDFKDQPLGDFTTIYTVSDGECTDSVNLTIRVVENVSDPNCSITAGADKSGSITQSEADAIPSWDEVRKLYIGLLDAGVPANGEFSPSIWELINAYGENKIGNFTTTYTVRDGNCVDSAELMITVVADPPADPNCLLSAGPDNSKTITFSEAAAILSWDEARKLFLSLLEPGVSRNGSFDPSIWDLINDFNRRGLGSYSTTYTVIDGDCTDSVVLTIKVVAD